MPIQQICSHKVTVLLSPPTFPLCVNLGGRTPWKLPPESLCTTAPRSTMSAWILLLHGSLCSTPCVPLTQPQFLLLNAANWLETGTQKFKLLLSTTNLLPKDSTERGKQNWEAVIIPGPPNSACCGFYHITPQVRVGAQSSSANTAEAPNWRLATPLLMGPPITAVSSEPGCAFQFLSPLLLIPKMEKETKAESCPSATPSLC